MSNGRLVEVFNRPEEENKLGPRFICEAGCPKKTCPSNIATLFTSKPRSQNSPKTESPLRTEQFSNVGTIEKRGKCCPTREAGDTFSQSDRDVIE